MATEALDPDEVTRHLLARASWSATRSSGPGGQRRDKVATRAELVVEQGALEGLPPDVAQRLLVGLKLDERPLRIEIQEQRYLSQNRAIAEGRLDELVAIALAPPPPPRKRTRPTASAKKQRLHVKALRGVTKTQRRPPEADD